MGLLGWVSCLIVPTQKVRVVCKIKQSRKAQKEQTVQKFSEEINYVRQRESMIFLLKKALKVLYWDIKATIKAE